MIQNRTTINTYTIVLIKGAFNLYLFFLLKMHYYIKYTIDKLYYNIKNVYIIIYTQRICRKFTQTINFIHIP